MFKDVSWTVYIIQPNFFELRCGRPIFKSVRVSEPSRNLDLRYQWRPFLRKLSNCFIRSNRAPWVQPSSWWERFYLERPGYFTRMQRKKVATIRKLVGSNNEIGLFVKKTIARNTKTCIRNFNIPFCHVSLRWCMQAANWQSSEILGTNFLMLALCRWERFVL